MLSYDIYVLELNIINRIAEKKMRKKIELFMFIIY